MELARGTQLSFFSCVPFAYLGVLCTAEGAWEDASRYYSDAAALAQDAGNPEMLCYAQSRLVEQEVLRGRPQEAISRLQPWLDASDLTWMYDVLVLSVLAEAYVDTDDTARAEEVAEHATMRAGLMHNWVDGVEALRVRGKSLSMQGRWEEASAALEEALSRSRSMPYPYAEGRILREYGMLHARKGEPKRARERFRVALAVFGGLRAAKDAARTERELLALGPG